MNLCSSFAPNVEDPVVFHELNDIISNMAEGYIILVGDFNQVLDGCMDKTKFIRVIPKNRLAICMLMRDLGLTDMWHLLNPRERDDSFLSHRHGSQSRIDYF